MISLILVSVQFVLIGFLAWYGGVVGNMVANPVVAAGVGLGLWAITTMRFRFNILPEPRQDGALFTGGPYAVIRHPMYTAVLLVTLGFVFNRLDAVSVLAWVALVIDLLLKLGREEKMLADHFPEYAAYMTQTKRLIPGVY